MYRLHQVHKIGRNEEDITSH